MKVAIGLTSGELARYAIFYDSLLHLTPPQDVETIVIQARGANLAENMNGIAERALAMQCDAVFHVEDDHVYAPDTLTRLLSHDKAIVSGLYVGREPPFAPRVFSELSETGATPLALTPFRRGLVEAEGVGAGCLLIRTDVFRALEPPYWRMGTMSPDLDFCLRARRAGVEIWADLDCPVGHVMTGAVWPMYQPDGTWASAFVQRGPEILSLWPAAQRASELARR